jgi:hydrogenase-4 component E
MIIISLIIFAASLIYFFLSERVLKHINLLAIQGVMLFVIALINLIEINTLGLILILLETLFVKALLIPVFLSKLRRKNNLNRIVENDVPVFYSVVIVTGIIIFSFFAASHINSKVVDTKFFTIALSTILCGVYFIIIHRNIFNHIVGFLIMENGAFLLSLAVGGEFPFLVSMAVLIDVLIAVLIIGVFINRVGNTFGGMSISSLNKLKD